VGEKNFTQILVAFIRVSYLERRNGKDMKPKKNCEKEDFSTNDSDTK